MKRRSFLNALSSLPLLGGRAAAAPRTHERDIYQELGIPTFINAGEPFTSLSGAPVRPEVREAMNYAAGKYVRLRDVQKAVGERLASLLHCEAAMVTTGAASALTLGTAACMAGKDESKISRLPDRTGMPFEVVIQKAHRYDYEHAVRNCGAVIVEVETREQFEHAIGPQTACLLFNNRWTAQGRIKHEEFIAAGKKHRVPTFIDCASDIPPAGNLTKFTRLGYDLVTFSGGKGLRAPSSTGILMGRRDLVEAAILQHDPNDDTIGRGMKIDKEEVIGFLVAVELCLKEVPDPWFAASEKVLTQMGDELSRIKGVSAELFVPPVSYCTPHLRVKWDEAQKGISADQVRQALRSGKPSIETRTGPDPVIGLELTAWMLTGNDAEIVVSRIREALAHSPA